MFHLRQPQMHLNGPAVYMYMYTRHCMAMYTRQWEGRVHFYREFSLVFLLKPTGRRFVVNFIST